MNKRRLHHLFTEVRPIKPWYFVAASGASAVVGVLAFRNNYSKMVELRQAVFVADEKNGDVEAALRDLRAHVHGHMNTELTSGDNPIYPPIQLQYRYERLVKAQQDQIAQANSQIYTAAQEFCEQQNPTDFSGRNRVPCIQEYVTSRGVKTQVTVPDGLYKFNFVSPRWSPDVAGFSIIFSILFLVAAVALYITQHWLKRRTT